MPHYGGEDARAPSALDDYRGHAPDAPAALDYKYEEEPAPPAESKKTLKPDDDEDPWREPVRSPKRSSRVLVTDRLEPIADEMDSVAAEPASRRRPRRRPRARRAKQRREERSRSRYKNDDERVAQYFDNVDYSDDRGKFLEGEQLVLARESTTKVIKRKVRERLFAPPPPPPPVSMQGELGAGEQPDEREVDEEEPETRLLKAEKFVDPAEWSKPALVRYRPLIAESTTREEGPKHSSYQDYGDYYDQKKVNDIRNKLPTLLRRTSTIPDLFRGTPVRPKPDLLHALWPSRRAGQPLATETAPAEQATSPEHEPLPTGPPPVPDRYRTPTPDNISPVSFVTDVDAVEITASEVVTTTSPNSTAPSTTDQSLAEKSRLSILKKARLKERVKQLNTKKPPVLLHVTSHLPTVVMVEPATSPDPWMRAREVGDDSPETIDKVKRLMRQKLVARAKSIGELTDDWDQIVCDYVDIGMLAADTAPPTAPPPPTLHSLFIAALALLFL